MTQFEFESRIVQANDVNEEGAHTFAIRCKYISTCYGCDYAFRDIVAAAETETGFVPMTQVTQTETTTARVG